MKTMLVDKDRLIRDVCLESFKDFVKRFWHIVIPERLVWNWHMDVLCEELQVVGERLIKNEKKLYDLVINVPPGTSKSTIVTVMFPAWLWARKASLKVLSTSYAFHLSMDHSRKSRDVIQSELYTKLFGDIQMREDQNAKSHFANKAGGFRYTTSTGGTVTGMHGHAVISDDPLNPEEAVSEVELATANRFLTNTLPGRVVDKEVSVIILVMQRLHQNDPSAVLLKGAADNPVRHINLPAEITGKGRDVVRPRKYAAKYKDGLLDPHRLPRHVLKKMKARMGEYGYSGQMLQNPIPLGGGMFKADRIQIVATWPKMVDMKKVVRYWDKAGTLAKDGGKAHTAGVKMGEDKKGQFWIIHVSRFQEEAAARERIIKQNATTDTRVVHIGVEQEGGSGGKESAQATVKNLRGFVVRLDRPTGEKELRADPFSVQVNNDNVFMVKGAWNEAYLEEMRYFPLSTTKDQIDASSGAFAMLTNPRKKVGGGFIKQ